MSDKTKIEWTDATWNPVTGCTKVSQGCKHCYAERDWKRLQHLPRFAGRAFTDVACHPERLDQPLRWLKPRRIFVNSMSDLFHEDVPDEFIDRVFAVMSLSYRHTFQVLTKRPGRMRDYMMRDPMTGALRDLAWQITGWRNGQVTPFPRKNIWLGVSVEDQATANERIPLLLQTPAAVRWISAEPLLGPLDLDRGGWSFLRAMIPPPGNKTGWKRGLDWVVVGGESGQKARPMHPKWVRDLRDQCASADVAFLHKQNGEFASVSEVEGHGLHFVFPDGATVRRVGKKTAGRLLDGGQYTAEHGVEKSCDDAEAQVVTWLDTIMR